MGLSTDSTVQGVTHVPGLKCHPCASLNTNYKDIHVTRGYKGSRSAGRRDYAEMLPSACSKSARRSLQSSIPTETRPSPPPMPASSPAPWPIPAHEADPEGH